MAAAGGNNKLMQAYIVSSQSEAEALARAGSIAAQAVCSGVGARPCGFCGHCRKAKLGIHPDIMRITFDVDSSGKPKKSIGVGQIKALVIDSVVLPNEAERKVYIISPAQAMTVEAQNAALKLLEEPPEGVILILCVTSPMALLPTVRSRCTEIIAGSGESPRDPEARSAAESFLKAAASGNEFTVFRFCEENNGMSSQEAAAFVQAVREMITDMLCGREDCLGLSEARLFAIGALMEKCAAYLKVNVNVKQLFGLMEADTLKQDF